MEAVSEHSPPEGNGKSFSSEKQSEKKYSKEAGVRLSQRERKSARILPVAALTAGRAEMTGRDERKDNQKEQESEDFLHHLLNNHRDDDRCPKETLAGAEGVEEIASKLADPQQGKAAVPSRSRISAQARPLFEHIASSTGSGGPNRADHHLPAPLSKLPKPLLPVTRSGKREAKEEEGKKRRRRNWFSSFSCSLHCV